jgi:DNA-binding NarL/FixJ family response regulator
LETFLVSVVSYWLIPGGGLSISGLGLVVADDHHLVRHAVCRMLEGHGVRVLAQLGDGAQVVSSVATHAADAVVLDIGMPCVDGLEAARRLRRAAPEVGIVMISGRDDERSRRAAVHAGADAFVPKSAPPGELIAALEAVHADQKFAASRLRGARVRGLGVRSLTARELSVLAFVADGCSSVQVAAHLGVSPRTADVHRYNIMKKLGVGSIAELARLAERLGLVAEREPSK